MEIKYGKLQSELFWYLVSNDVFSMYRKEIVGYKLEYIMDWKELYILMTGYNDPELSEMSLRKLKRMKPVHRSLELSVLKAVFEGYKLKEKTEDETIEQIVHINRIFSPDQYSTHFIITVAKYISAPKACENFSIIDWSLYDPDGQIFSIDKIIRFANGFHLECELCSLFSSDEYEGSVDQYVQIFFNLKEKEENKEREEESAVSFTDSDISIELPNFVINKKSRFF